MPLVSATLGSELANLVPVDNEPDAINNFATAFDNYFQGATVAGIAVTPGTTAPAKSAMVAAMTGLSTAGAAAIQAGIVAYWTAIVPAAPTVWVTVPVALVAIPPPGLSGIAATLASVFSANATANAPLATAANNVAAALHAAQLGGVVVLSPPPPGGTPMPIL